MNSSEYGNLPKLFIYHVNIQSYLLTGQKELREADVGDKTLYSRTKA